MSNKSFGSLFLIVPMLVASGVTVANKTSVIVDEAKPSWKATANQQLAWDYDKNTLIDPAFGGTLGAALCGFLPDANVPHTTELTFDDLQKVFAKRHPEQAAEFQVLGFSEPDTGEVWAVRNSFPVLVHEYLHVWTFRNLAEPAKQWGCFSELISRLGEKVFYYQDNVNKDVQNGYVGRHRQLTTGYGTVIRGKLEFYGSHK